MKLRRGSFLVELIYSKFPINQADYIWLELQIGHSYYTSIDCNDRWYLDLSMISAFRWYNTVQGWYYWRRIHLALETSDL